MSGEPDEVTQTDFKFIIQTQNIMHLAIPPTPIRNPEKGFKTHPKKTRTESISAIETESAQPSSDGSSEKSLRSIIKGELCMTYFSTFAYSIIAFVSRTRM